MNMAQPNRYFLGIDGLKSVLRESLESALKMSGGIRLISPEQASAWQATIFHPIENHICRQSQH